MTTEQLLTKVREFATGNYCSCEGRIHDPENLMEKLLQECEKWEKEMSNEDWKKEFNKRFGKYTFCECGDDVITVYGSDEPKKELMEFIQSLLENKK